jgi:hypothetical protein
MYRASTGCKSGQNRTLFVLLTNQFTQRPEQ